MKKLLSNYEQLASFLLSSIICLIPATAFAHDPHGYAVMGIGFIAGFIIAIGVAIFVITALVKFRNERPFSKKSWIKLFVFSFAGLILICCTSIFDSNFHIDDLFCHSWPA